MPLTSLGIVLCGLCLIGVPGHRGLHQQVVSDPGGARARAVVAGVPDRAQLAARGRLCVALCRGGLLPRAARKDLPRHGEAPLSMLVPAWLLLAAQHLLRARHLVHAGLGSAGRAVCCWGPRAMSARTADCCAPARADGRRSADRACAVAAQPARGASRSSPRRCCSLCVLALLPAVLAGGRPALTLLEVLPGLQIAFEVEPLGMLFALIASGAVDRQLALLHRLHARQRRGAPDALLRLLRAGAGGHDGHRLRRQHVHAVPVLRNADARHLPAGHAPRHRRGAPRRPHLPRRCCFGTSIVFLLPALVFTWFAAGTTDFAPGGILRRQARARRAGRRCSRSTCSASARRR